MVIGSQTFVFSPLRQKILLPFLYYSICLSLSDQIHMTQEKDLQKQMDRRHQTQTKHNTT